MKPTGTIDELGTVNGDPAITTFHYDYAKQRSMRQAYVFRNGHWTRGLTSTKADLLDYDERTEHSQGGQGTDARMEARTTTGPKGKTDES